MFTEGCFAGVLEVVEAGMAHRRRPCRPASGIAGINPFERLTRIVRSNERLQDELEALRARERQARTYLDGPGANAVLGQAVLERLRVKRSGVLARLRANRREAGRLLAEAGHEVPAWMS